ncbi:NF038129 family PEP-CTERM protein [Massilia sp. DJPM01]|uniref:NF038129 family PEP-CTERM protein n=1 Tax=Massilia sp. DJPM01 TaxID=3024404 RepID=UPI00259FCD63|nr:NF038129 family PEP-CTERM protein [Massilia sp. DJPM01]MDM5179417.1 NF038129 family PEP-CTERM protein [Massilia sp. DJPM01]
MFNFKTFVKQALLAATLAFGIGNATAGPTYHVDIDTTNYSGNGSMDFWLSSFTGASGAMATVSNFTGNLGAETFRFGSVGGALPASAKFDNSEDFSSVTHGVTLGEKFGFDVNFSGDFLTVPGFASTFSIAMYDALGNYLVQPNFLLEFSLNPPTIDDAASVSYTAARNVRVSVPEPSDMLLVMTGLGLVAFVRRRAAKAPR